MFFAARNLIRFAILQFFRAKSFEYRRGTLLSVSRLQMVQAEFDILFNSEMRKERKRLKNISDVARLGRKIGLGCTIEQDFFARRDATTVRPQESRDAIQKRGFACAGRAKQNGDAGRHFEGNIENEIGRACATPFFAKTRDERCGIYFAAHGDHTRRLMA